MAKRQSQSGQKRARKVRALPGTNGHSAQVEESSGYLTADKVRDEKISWLLSPYLARGVVTLVVGGVQAGKSSFLTAVAAHVTGGPPLDGPRTRTPGNVLLYSPEEHAGSQTKPRLRAAGCDLSRVTFGDLREDGTKAVRFQLPGDLPKLGDLVGKLKAHLVVLDPVTSYSGGGADQKDPLVVRAILEGLGEIAETHQALILCTVHYRKSREGSPLDWVAGHSAWVQVPRVVLALGTDPDQPNVRVVTLPKTNLSKLRPSRQFTLEDVDEVPRFVLGQVTSLQADDLTGTAESSGERDALQDACAFLRDLLEDGEVPVKAVQQAAEDAAIRGATLRRAKARLKIDSEGRGQRPNRFWVWIKPKTGWPT